MRMHLAAREGKLGALSSMGRIKSKRKLATVAEASQMARHSDFAKRQDKFPATVKSKHVDLHSSSTGKKLKTGTRRSQRIRSLPKPAENQSKPQVCEVDDSDSEIEVELGVQVQEKSSKPTIKPQDVQMVTVKRKEEKSPKIKKTQEVVDNAPRLNGDVVVAALTEEERLDNITEKTHQMESSFVMGLMAKKQDKAPVMVKTKPASESSVGRKIRTLTSRRSERITNLAKAAEKRNHEPQVCDLDDSGGETEVELGVQIVKGKVAEPVIKPRGSAGDDGRIEKNERARKVKKVQQVLSKPQGLNDGVIAGTTVEEERVNNAEKTQEVITQPLGLNDGASAAEPEEEQRVNSAEKTHQVVAERAERSSSQNASDRERRYRTLYAKTMRRLDALTGERNSLNRQLAWAQAKLGVLDDFRDQISELTEKLDIANGRLEVYQKTMNPQMVDMLRDFLASANQSQTGEVPRSTSSEKDSGVRRSIKPRSRSSRKRKPPFK